MNKTTTKVVAGIAVVAIAGALILIPNLNNSKPSPLESTNAAPSETNSNATRNANEKNTATTPAEDTVLPSVSEENTTDNTDNTDTAMTTIYKDSYKTVVLFNQAQIEALTGNSLDADSIKDIQDKLEQEDTWTAKNFPSSEAKLIADAANEESHKLQSILMKITQNNVSDLKLIIVHNKHHSSAHFGSDNREQTH
ncbi:hypothetical protein RE628_07030 [Paenibacillus sp. D2_2]|uniref:hypothetical protein n=1 Tax=Paenibacillus sp. D2_2 TaxID=3073092 RepID=UPI0028163C99|nr:hypothetical protein [Paenibacillus sp. D2_2]WMT42164.1 hypothetical protein RE628_07030 [Paenibacillus sp. D2_2]